MCSNSHGRLRRRSHFVSFRSDSCDLLIEEDRRASFTRNSLFLFDEDVDMDNEVRLSLYFSSPLFLAVNSATLVLRTTPNKGDSGT